MEGVVRVVSLTVPLLSTPTPPYLLHRPRASQPAGPLFCPTRRCLLCGAWPGLSLGRVRAVRRAEQESLSQEEFAQTRVWRSIDGRHCVGRMVPCPTDRTPAEEARAEAERELVRGREVGEIEVNVQLGTFSLSTSRLEGVDERIAACADFQEMFGPDGQMAQCATIKAPPPRPPPLVLSGHAASLTPY